MKPVKFKLNSKLKKIDYPKQIILVKGNRSKSNNTCIGFDLHRSEYEQNKIYSIQLEVASKLDSDFSTTVQCQDIDLDFINGLIKNLHEIKEKLYQDKYNTSRG